MDDPGVTDIIAVNHRRVVYEKDGVIRVADDGFRSESHLRLVIWAGARWTSPGLQSR